MRTPPVPDRGEEVPIGVAQRSTVEPVTKQHAGLAAVLGHPPQVIRDAAQDAGFCGVVVAQHRDEPRLVLADQLRVDGRRESRLVREVVVERADTDLGLAPHLVQRGDERAVDGESAPSHLQQPAPARPKASHPTAARGIL